ncbi:hypothetical protein L0F63_003769 [Massospora cicadina]|nr:hypothetical protein L0F63_003769 [Massospora cicadina]
MPQPQDDTIMKTVRISPFISKLFEILSDANNRHIISWDQDGTGFEIYSLTEFENTIIKNHFKHKTITSFFRQLNLYDFQRTSDGRKTRGKPGMGHCTFRHRYFTLSSPQNLCRVRRQSKKKPSKQSPPNLASAPPELPQKVEPTPPAPVVQPQESHQQYSQAHYPQYPQAQYSQHQVLNGMPYMMQKEWGQPSAYLPITYGMASNIECQPYYELPMYHPPPVPFVPHMEWPSYTMDQSSPFPFTPNQLSSPTESYQRYYRDP